MAQPALVLSPTLGVYIPARHPRTHYADIVSRWETGQDVRTISHATGVRRSIVRRYVHNWEDLKRGGGG